ncbi:MAG TPA: aminopeptidase [Candidatus Choladousia intestinipullorum]|nr:aminopeptidase [Candidatus Choladousia intestinipullorum]
MKQEERVKKIAEFIVHKGFKVKEGEVVVISGDWGSNHFINEAVAKEVYDAGAKAAMFITKPAPTHGKAADAVIPFEPFVAMMEHVDYWLDTGTMGWLYSDAFETVLKKYKNMKYWLLSIMGVDELEEMFSIYTPEMAALCKELNALVMKHKKLRIVDQLGTDCTFEIDENHRNVAQIGEINEPGFYTCPGMYNMVPKIGSLNGKAVVKCIYADPWGLVDDPVTVNFKDGRITTIEGKDTDVVNRFTKWLASFDDNIYKVSHINFGLLPKYQDFTDHGIKNERMWGGINFGFGHTSPVDMPPEGQISANHLDICTAKSTAYVGDELVMKDGEFVHPSMKAYADKILADLA